MRAREVDRMFRRALGETLWKRTKRIGRRLDDHVDRVAIEVGLPPEGVHPVYANAAKALIRAAARRGSSPSAEKIAAADQKLAALLRGAPKSALPLAADHLRSAGVSTRLAPESLRVLKRRLPPMSGPLRRSLKRVTREASSAGAARTSRRLRRADRRLAALVKAAPTLQLLEIASRLGSAGLIDRHRGHYQWSAGAKSKLAPRTVEALDRRNFREEVLRQSLGTDAKYQRLREKKNRLLDQAADALRRASGGTGETTKWKRIVDWGQRLQQKLREANVAARGARGPPKRGKLEKRSTEEVMKDHLAMRKSGRLDLDLARNYAPDVMMVSNYGTFHGKKGMQKSADILSKVVPDGQWTIERLFVSGNVAFETWSAVADGKVISGFDSFLIKNGKIVLQTAYFGGASSSAKPESLDHRARPPRAGAESSRK